MQGSWLQIPELPGKGDRLTRGSLRDGRESLPCPPQPRSGHLTGGEVEIRVVQLPSGQPTFPWDYFPLARTFRDYRLAPGVAVLDELGIFRRASAPSPESKAAVMHLPGYGKLDGIQPGRVHSSSLTHSRNSKCAVARAAQHMGALQRRNRYLERVRHYGSPDFWRAHRLDAAGADHIGER